ncbi:MAG: DEAD/DEAH box helicase [Bdellovibrionales bacterium]|nr:DEAD/DEAH box helicase [Bdellovibrionales bacterium]
MTFAFSAPALRPFQERAIQTLLSSDCDHLIVQSPTGSGKSRIFQDLARVHGLRILLISPLVALSRQHQEKLLALGVRTAVYTGGTREHPDLHTQVWILSPESADYLRAGSWRPDLLVVDECHTLWEWGRSFRPAIAAIPGFLEKFSIPRSLWLSATIPPPAMDQLLSVLPKGPRTQVQGSFGLPPRLDLRALKISWAERMEFISEWAQTLARRQRTGVLFAPTRSLCERLSRSLRAAGVRSAYYHAGLSREERRVIEWAFRDGEEYEVLCATSAFGMGMDFDHLDEAVIFTPPSNLLALAQAMGRVARADRPGRIWILWDPSDLGFALQKDAELDAVFAYLDGPSDPFSLKNRLQGCFTPKPGHACEDQSGTVTSKKLLDKKTI